MDASAHHANYIEQQQQRQQQQQHFIHSCTSLIKYI